MSTKTKTPVTKLPLAEQIRQITETQGRAPFVTCPLCKHGQVPVVTTAAAPLGAIVAGDRPPRTFLGVHEIPSPASVIHGDPNVEIYVAVQCPASGAPLRRANVSITRR